MQEKWWAIYEIRFTKAQMRFLIEHLGQLKVGSYPQDPYKDSGYTDSAIRQRRYREPAQNRVLELAAEVESRLELVMGYISGWPRPTKKVRRNKQR